MNANKKLIVLLAVVTAALTGCAVTDEYDLYEITNTVKTIFFEEVLNTSLSYARTAKSCDAELPQNQKVVAREYGEYSVVHFPEEYAGTDYCFPYVEDIANAYHVTKFQGNVGVPIEFEWIGSIELGREIHEIAELNNDNYIELADSSDMARLFAMSQTYENNEFDSPAEIVWNRCIDTDVLVVRDGLCEISEQDEGYHVLLDVESNTRKGYASVFVDTSADMMTHFVYTEALEQYDDERARTFIDNLQLSDGVITQKKDKICVEAGDRMDFVPAEYFDANPWELTQCSVDLGHKVWHTFGDYSCVISLFNQTYSLQVEVRDTTPPEVKVADISGFVLEGTLLKPNLYEYGLIKIKDLSKPYKVYYKEIAEEITVTEELCDAEGNISITVCVEDAAGNVTEKHTKLKYMEDNLENTWMKKIGFDVDLFWQNASQEYVRYNMIDSEYTRDITFEEAIEWTEEFLLLEKAKEGIMLAESVNLDVRYESEDTDNMEAFFEGLSYVPENVLQEYERRGWYLKVIDDEMDNQITGGNSAGDTWYDYKRIRYTTASYQNGETIPHEFGHFVDYILGRKSETAEFKALYKETKKNRNIKKTEKYDKWDTYDVNGIYRGYSYANEHEFFADSFAQYLTNSTKFHIHYPEIYDYIEKCINAL
ncbi:MAG: hypothetical protein UHN47_06850 [Lachnospiraceae bacterium]|nr:hypothetical protein [Lachnospiraceae bacterium]